MVQCYATSTDAKDEEKDTCIWYEQFTVSMPVPRHDMLMIIGDMNAKVVADNTNCSRDRSPGMGIKA